MLTAVRDVASKVDVSQNRGFASYLVAARAGRVQALKAVRGLDP